MNHIRVETKAMLVESVAARWRQQYLVNKLSGMWYDENKKIVSGKLSALVNPTEKEINDIIGNDTWTLNECSVCREDVQKALVIEDCDRGRMKLCEKCISVGLAMLKNKWPPRKEDDA